VPHGTRKTETLVEKTETKDEMLDAQMKRSSHKVREISRKAGKICGEKDL